METLKHISEERRNKVDAIKHPLGKYRSIGAGYLIALGLREAGLDPFTERISLSSKGKPFLPDHPDVHFNLSHSGNYVVCAFADKTVGIDIEEIRPVKPSLIKFSLSKHEMAEYEATPDEFREQKFYEMWTSKEAFLKHIAKGLSVRPADIGTIYKDKIGQLNFHVWHDIPGYIITLCSSLEKPELTEVRL
ncbi:MAG: 4'-phosphopantetheinyl transferase superfamily protein [Lachnospiraceae bacterium]|nr:4'-phosphopantetheinyl transferase superfamily protein [Lachnospiraceae bacterium]